MAQYVGILTAGGDSPGLNAAIRGVGKAAIGAYGMQLIGFRDGFRGLMQDRIVRLSGPELSGILTLGGTILGTSRDKPHRMPVGDQTMDMTSVMVETYEKHHLDALVCLGGGGTQKNAYHLAQNGLNIITMPKTIDNDVAMTDMTFGFDTALGIATEAIDRLHSTAHSHHRIIVVELMGHNAGWLALGAGIAGGADVILLPEINYDINIVAEKLRRRQRRGSGFSIVAVSEGAMSNGQCCGSVRSQRGEKSGQGRQGEKGGQGEVGCSQAGTDQPYVGAVESVGRTDRIGVPRNDFGPSATGRHPVGGRPAVGDPPRHGLCRLHRSGYFRGDGWLAWRYRRGRSTEGCGRQAPHGPTRS